MIRNKVTLEAGASFQGEGAAPGNQDPFSWGGQWAQVSPLPEPQDADARAGSGEHGSSRWCSWAAPSGLW